MLGGPIGARPFPLSSGLAVRFSLSEEEDAAGEDDIEGPLMLLGIRAWLGPGEASYRSSSKGAGDSDIFADLAIASGLWLRVRLGRLLGSRRVGEV